MKKSLKYSIVSIGAFLVLLGVLFGIMYAVVPQKMRRLLRLAGASVDVYVDRLNGTPYTKGRFDGIDVSKHNGVIEWEEVAKNGNVKFVYIKATEGKGHVDRRYRRNIRQAREVGLKVGSYHFFTSRSSATAQFKHFSEVAKKDEQDLIPVLDVEEGGIKGKWRGKQLRDSVRVFMELAKRHYGKYPILYCNESFYIKKLHLSFSNNILFIANYNHSPWVGSKGKHQIWQYSERGHLKGIGEHVDLNRLAKGTSVDDLMLNE